jgi:glycosyltransferase involved in cell wall biosynthesis
MSEFPAGWHALRTSLCHDWLTGMRGGERVLEVLCRGFPNAPILTLLHNRPSVSDTINAHPVRTSWLQRVPGIYEHYRFFLPLFPLAARGLRPPEGDLVLSTSHCVAKSVRPRPGTRHLCYCFTPMRYAWTFQREYFGAGSVRSLAVAPVLAWLRQWDRRTASRVDRFVAISRTVADRIAAYYGREADIVYPPVDAAKWTRGPATAGAYDLVVSALVPYKRIDLAVRAYNGSGRPLKVVGGGGDEQALRAMAGPNIEFLGRVPDNELLEVYRNCRMLVFPGEEDFGIVPLEAQACGRPVVAYGRGGATETIRDGVTGVFFPEQTEASLLDAVERCAAIDWDPAVIRAHAEQFDTAHFIASLADSIDRCLA